VILLVILALPLIAAAVSAALRAPRAGALATIASSVSILVLAVIVAIKVSSGAVIVGLPHVLAADGLSALIVLLVSFVAAAAAIYSFGYMERSAAHQLNRLRIYYANYNVFVFAMLAIPLVTDPTLVWIFVELTTLSSALLVSFANTRQALEAAWKYVTLSLMGAGIALLGFLTLFAALQAAHGGAFTWGSLLVAAPRMPPALLKTAFLLILVGFGTKVGLVPLHTWLPDAHSQAPSSVCALLSGIETTSVLYVILRLLPVLNASSAAAVANWMPVLGLISVGVAAFLLLQVRDYKRMFAFSTVEHMGIILVAAGLGSQAAHYGAMYQVLGHTLTKSFCFFAAGAAVLTVTTREIASVHGLIRTSPTTAASLLLGALAIAGAPPLVVFLSEFSILRAAVAEGRYIIVALLAAFIVIAFFGVLRHVNQMVFGRAGEGAERRLALVSGRAAAASNPTPTSGLPRSCTAVLVLTGVLVVVLGIYLPSPLHSLLSSASQALQR
jgi:hydrogenase-4 component F